MLNTFGVFPLWEMASPAWHYGRQSLAFQLLHYNF